MRSLTFLLATLASVLGVTAAAQAGIVFDFTIAGDHSVAASLSSTVTVDITAEVTGDTALARYQFTVFWDPTELSYIDNPPLGGGGLTSDDSLNNTGPQLAHNSHETRPGLLAGRGNSFSQATVSQGAFLQPPLSLQPTPSLPRMGR